MTQITEATFSGGVLRPERELGLREHERVRLIVQELGGGSGEPREGLLDELRAAIARSGFLSNGVYPTRDELHDRA